MVDKDRTITRQSFPRKRESRAANDRSSPGTPDSRFRGNDGGVEAILSEARVATAHLTLTLVRDQYTETGATADPPLPSLRAGLPLQGGGEKNCRRWLQDSHLAGGGAPSPRYSHLAGEGGPSPRYSHLAGEGGPSPHYSHLAGEGGPSPHNSLPPGGGGLGRGGCATFHRLNSSLDPTMDPAHGRL